ncbi:hypothetical protein EJ04DRAFT_478743, partial [Polyplosphaeria fusca]
MHPASYAAFVFAVLASSVASHGYVTDPKPRMPGDAMAKACGQQMFNNQKSDNFGNVQGELQVAKGQSDFDAAACNVFQCKGYQFEDNKANVQTFAAGQTVPITVDIRAPHTGIANVSIVKTSSNSVIGQPLISWDVYASNSATIPDDQKNFDITIPDDLGSECSVAGDCVIQWFWDARSIDQTYEACIDFAVNGAGNTNPESSPAPTATSKPTSSSVPTSTMSAVNNVATSTSNLAATS